jgi:hypothetical protein
MSTIIKGVSDIIHIYYLTWVLSVSFIIRKWKVHGEATEKIRKYFSLINNSEPVNLTLNVIGFNILIAILFLWAGFTRSFFIFAVKYIQIPCLLGSLAFYFYKFGISAFHLDFTSIKNWLYNFYLSLGYVFFLMKLLCNYIIIVIVLCYHSLYLFMFVLMNS